MEAHDRTQHWGTAQILVVKGHNYKLNTGMNMQVIEDSTGHTARKRQHTRYKSTTIAVFDEDTSSIRSVDLEVIQQLHYF